jgi:uncharacterized membrane protein
MLNGMRRWLAISLALVTLALAAPASAQGDPSVRGVLFFSPTCGHCHRVVEDHLPGIFESSGGAPEQGFDVRDEAAPAATLLSNGTLELLLVNVKTDPGADLYLMSSAMFEIPSEMEGVPRLVMGDQWFVGSGDIPAALPGLIDQGLAAGGIDWPEIEGIAELLAGAGVVWQPAAATTTTEAAPASSEPQPSTTTPTTTSTVAPTTTTTMASPFPDLGGTSTGVDGIVEIGEPLTTIGEKFRNDLAGNILAVVVLAGMLASLVLVALLLRRGRSWSSPSWLVPVLAVAGVVVAVYLTYVETSGAEAVCGPVGNCNAVQESKFALLFGVIHVGLVGLISYAAVVATWLAARLLGHPWSDWARMALALGAAVGVAFSCYLTFLEPFVIGATCIWCLSSALIVTVIFWLTASPGWEAWKRLQGR